MRVACNLVLTRGGHTRGSAPAGGNMWVGRGERAPTRGAATEYGTGVGTAEVGAGLVPAQEHAMDRADPIDQAETSEECAQRRP